MQSIHDFFGAWGETDPRARADAIRAATSEPLSYADPRTPEVIASQEALIEYVGMFATAAPGAIAKVVNLSSTLDVHRATVAFVMADGMQQMGQYTIELDTVSYTHLTLPTKA